MKSYKRYKNELKDYLISHDVRDDYWWIIHRKYVDLLWYGKLDYYLTCCINLFKRA